MPNNNSYNTHHNHFGNQNIYQPNIYGNNQPFYHANHFTPNTAQNQIDNIMNLYNQKETMINSSNVNRIDNALNSLSNAGFSLKRN